MFRLLLLHALLLFASQLFASDIVIKEAWVREPPPAAKTMGGFMVLTNLGTTERQLVAATAPHFETIMIHRTVIKGDIASMIHLQQLLIPAGGRIEFKPGGYHLMLLRPEQNFTDGDQIDITLTFSDGETVQHPFQVLKSGNMGTMDHKQP